MGLAPKQFTIKTVLPRFDALGDLFAGVLNKPQRLEEALAKMEELLTA